MTLTMCWNGTGEKKRAARGAMPGMLLTPLERALLRLLVSGYTLENAAASVGLSPSEAQTLLEELQGQCGVSSLPRLLTLAILNAWV